MSDASGNEIRRCSLCGGLLARAGAETYECAACGAGGSNP